MRLKRLILEDFGLYRGRQAIDFSQRTKYGRVRPIILCGGHNGAGKTTVLESLQLCLYGKLALGARPTEAEYHTYLRDRVHRSRASLVQARHASVTVEFDYSRSGQRDEYAVTRAWEVGDKGKVTERLDVLRNGKSLEDVDSTFWGDFVRSLIPPGLSQLFFFDGEKIQKLAEEGSDSDSQTLAESVKALLGLDLVERLQADLDLYVSREIKQNQQDPKGQRIAELEEEETKLTDRIGGHLQTEASLRAKLDQLNLSVGRAEQALIQDGQSFAQRRGEARERKAQLEATGARIEREIREHCDGILPFALCPTVTKQLVGQLESEATAQSSPAPSVIKTAVEWIERGLTAGEFPKSLGWDAATRSAVKKQLHRIGEEHTSRIQQQSEAVLHGLSGSESREVIAAAHDALRQEPKAIGKLVQELLTCERDLGNLQRQLNRSPETDELAPLVRGLKSAQEKLSTVTAELHRTEEERSELEKELARCQRERSKLVERARESNSLDQKVELAARARTALEAYHARLSEAKVAQLQRVASECFGALCRKGDLVAKIEIHPTTFAVQLIDSTGRRLSKSDLSAGEKQIYAISLLWALTKVSGRPLPMIIDTPLGRLDSKHRELLVERYFPYAAHQVIILSTDTEVDEEYFEALRPHISHCIHLDHHEREAWTEAREGYFWREDGDAETAA